MNRNCNMKCSFIYIFLILDANASGILVLRYLGLIFSNNTFTFTLLYITCCIILLSFHITASPAPPDRRPIRPDEINVDDFPTHDSSSAASSPTAATTELVQKIRNTNDILVTHTLVKLQTATATATTNYFLKQQRVNHYYNIVNK